MGSHKNLSGENIHVPITWTYADSIARTNDSGFIESDKYKLAIQSDDNSIWMLVDVSSGGLPTWNQLGTSGAGDMSKVVYDTDQNDIDKNEQ